MITGDDRGKVLEEKLNRFKNTPTSMVLLTTLQKSAEGLNLQCAHTVIILEPWWNPQKIFQAMGRIDRLDQKKNIFVFLLCYNDGSKSIIDEEKIYFDQMEKKTEEINAVYKKSMELEDNLFDKNRLKRLPITKYFRNTDAFEYEFSAYLDRVYAKASRPNKFDFISINKGKRSIVQKPLEQTNREITEKAANYFLHQFNNPLFPGKAAKHINPVSQNVLPSDMEDVKDEMYPAEMLANRKSPYIPGMCIEQNHDELQEVKDIMRDGQMPVPDYPDD
jgi:hypothetical protein